MKRSALFLFLFLLSLSSFAQQPTLWGMTSYGGTDNVGTIFKVNGDGTGFSSVFSFDVTSGYIPRGSLCLAPNGKFYGTTNGGGSQSVGTVFCFDPANSAFTKIVDFNYTNGAYGWGSLTLADNGMLYGNSYGGANGNGNIFRVNPTNNTFSNLYSLGSGDGASPGGKMALAANGLLYGMTAYDGAHSGGTIFSFNTNGNVYNNVHDFNTPDGRTGYGSLVAAADSNLYGMTRNGGMYGVGVLFRFNPALNAYTKLMDFDTLNGKWSWNSLIEVAGSKLFGMTTNGGANARGVIFSYDYSSSTYQLEHSFDYANGAVPFGGVVQAGDGLLYGMTFNGGSDSSGTVFRFDASIDSFSVIHNFQGLDGANPSGDLVERNEPVILSEHTSFSSFLIYPNPVTDHVRIVRSENAEEASSIFLIDAVGRLIKKVEFRREETFVDIDLRALP